jgi:hypothetical protein
MTDYKLQTKISELDNNRRFTSCKVTDNRYFCVKYMINEQRRDCLTITENYCCSGEIPSTEAVYLRLSDVESLSNVEYIEKVEKELKNQVKKDKLNMKK